METMGAVMYLLSCGHTRKADNIATRLANTMVCVLCGARMFIIAVYYE